VSVNVRRRRRNGDPLEEWEEEEQCLVHGGEGLPPCLLDGSVVPH
jgi:hypothetical protein